MPTNTTNESSDNLAFSQEHYPASPTTSPIATTLKAGEAPADMTLDTSSSQSPTQAGVAENLHQFFQKNQFPVGSYQDKKADSNAESTMSPA